MFQLLLQSSSEDSCGVDVICRQVLLYRFGRPVRQSDRLAVKFDRPAVKSDRTKPPPAVRQFLEDRIPGVQQNVGPLVPVYSPVCLLSDLSHLPNPTVELVALNPNNLGPFSSP